MAAPKVQRRFDAAMVRTSDGSLVRVNRGQPLPEDMAAGEQARLGKAGAFDAPPAEQTVHVVVEDSGPDTEE